MKRLTDPLWVFAFTLEPGQRPHTYAFVSEEKALRFAGRRLRQMRVTELPETGIVKRVDAMSFTVIAFDRRVSVEESEREAARLLDPFA